MNKKNKINAMESGAKITRCKNDALCTFYFLKVVHFIGNLTLLTNLSYLDLCHERD
jgi:hypothetical protein